MALILNIDTAVEKASVCVADGSTILGTLISPTEKESASWLHIAIRRLMMESGLTLQQLNAIAVTSGPGSYTGLRVGMATAKGLCYALTLPLITLNTLHVMAAGANTTASLLCPMIDARRMEVFTALLRPDLTEVSCSSAMILDETSFEKELSEHTIAFFGNGSVKANQVIKHPNASFPDVMVSAADMVQLAAKEFEQQQFSELAYAEPFYGKDFHSSIPKKLY